MASGFPVCVFVSVMDPCEERNGGCTQLCLSEGGRVQCSCRPGFTLAGDAKNCEGEEHTRLFLLA